MTRRFIPITVPSEAGRRRVHRIQCSECPVSHDVSANTWGGARAIEDLLAIWRRGGWTVSKREGHDLCPNCTGKRLRRRRAGVQDAPLPLPSQPPLPVLPEAPTEFQPVIIEDDEMARPKSTQKTEETKPVAAEPPRTPTFDEKRLIILSLQDHYVSEVVGYEPGYTDQRVGNELGVPWKWVAEIRDAMFGPVRDNEEVREVLAEARSLKDEVDATISSIEDMIRPLQGKQAALDRRIAAIEKALG